MITENLSTLKINKFKSVEQYEKALAKGLLDLSDICLVPESDSIVQKHDLEANWLTLVDFIPAQGEFIIYDAEVDKDGNTLALPNDRSDPYDYVRIKIGDGKTPVNSLNFIEDVTRQWVEDKKYITEIPSEYITESELDAKGYLTEHQDLSEYALKTEIPTVPTDISAFTNDAGYLKSVPSQYVTEDELTAKGYLTEHQNISHLAAKTDIPTKVSQLTNDENYISSIPADYAKKDYIDTAVANLVNSAPEALNTLGELAEALKTHEDAYDALLETVGSKASTEDLENMKDELNDTLKVATTQNGGLKVTGNNQIDIDDSIVFILDCVMTS